MNRPPLTLSRRAFPLRAGVFGGARSVSSKATRSTAGFGGRSEDREALLWPPTDAARDAKPARSPLQRMGTSSLVRNVLLGTAFTSPRMVKLALPAMHTVANSQSLLTHPDRNPIVRFVVKRLIYDQFCAGVNQKEVTKTREAIRGQGFAGIILCPGREIQISKNNELRSTASGELEDQIRQWKEGCMETLDMIGEGDWMGIKMTGAGTKVTRALMADEEPPEEFYEAMTLICETARSKNCRIWIDAEQQVLQAAIDRWTIDMMRRHNKDGRALVYNTLQAYLKASRTKLKHQLALADREGWTLAVKLVRGAYIANDRRELIHDTKSDTDDSYNGLVRDMLTGTNLGFSEEAFPKMQLFLAGHNPHSVAVAAKLISTLVEQGRLKVLPDFGQLQGMADLLGCELLEHCDETARMQSAEGEKAKGTAVVPKVYKCLTWGTVQECIQYLFRRLVENSGGSDRMKDGLSAYSDELRRRLLRTAAPSGRWRKE